MDKINLLEELITKYFYSNLSKEEKQWMASVTQKDLDSYDWQAAYGRFLQKISDQAGEEATTSRRSNYLLKWAIGIAASLLVLLLSTYVSYQQGQNKIEKAFANIVVTTPNGSCTKVNLPDGSVVMLNAGSKIVYSQGYGVTDRTVRIEGEGYFEVKKDKDKPFTVTSGNVVVKVLGTKFNFRDYPEDSTALVALDEGKVNMTSLTSCQQINLKPSQHVILDKESGKMRLGYSNALGNKGKWTEGTIAFNGESMKDITKLLERTYNVNFTFSNASKESLHFYGIFYKDTQSIKDIIEALSSTGNIKYKIKGRNIIIY